MKKNKTRIAYIIPGFSESAKLKPYQEIAKAFRKKGIKPISVHITWRKKVLTNQIKQFLDQYKKADEVYVLGFSLGAMIAFITASQTKPKILFLVSLSPWFKEDMKSSMAFFKKKMSPKEFKEVFDSSDLKNQHKDMIHYSFKSLVKNIHAKTILVGGSKELEDSISYKRIYGAHKAIKNSKVIVAKGAEHDIRQIAPTIKELISKL